MTAVASGFAIKTRNGIDLRTVGPTKAAAMVNWLVIDRRVIIQGGASDAAVEGAFAMLTAAEVADTGYPQVVTVTVREAAH